MRRLPAFVISLAALVGAPSVLAWKPTTHQYAVDRSIDQMPDSWRKATLRENIRYVRAGSMGPDLWYPVLSSFARYWRNSPTARQPRTGLPGGDSATLGWPAPRLEDRVPQLAPAEPGYSWYLQFLKAGGRCAFRPLRRRLVSTFRTRGWPDLRSHGPKGGGEAGTHRSRAIPPVIQAVAGRR